MVHQHGRLGQFPSIVVEARVQQWDIWTNCDYIVVSFIINKLCIIMIRITCHHVGS